MSTTHLRRGSAARLVAASAAVAVAAVGAVAASSATAHASTSTSSAAVAPTSISIRAVHGHTQPGKADAILGNLHVQNGVDPSGRTVALEAKTPGESEFAPVGTTTSGEHGGLRLAVAPEVTTRYRWDFAGATDARARKSGVATVKVVDGQHHAHRLATSLSIRAVHRLVNPQGLDTIKGQLRSHGTQLPHRLVILLAHPAGSSGWNYAGAERTAGNGQVTYQVHPAASTAYRLQFPGTTLFQPSRSGVARVGVRPSVSITASPTRVDPGETTTVGGVVTQQGAPVVGSTVDLLARVVEKHSSFRQVGSAVTGADGTVSISATPAQDTVYRLRLEHSDGVPGSLSRSVEVRVRYPSSLSIRGKHAAAGYVVTGTLRGHGQAIRHAEVALLAEAPGATEYTQVDTQSSGRFGGVMFTETEAAGTSYRLSFGGGNRFAASASGTVID